MVEIDHKDIPDSPTDPALLTRRQLLLGGGGLAIAYVGHRVADQFPLLQASYDAFNARPDYETPFVEDLKKEGVSYDRIFELYRRYFATDNGETFNHRSSFDSIDFQKFFEYHQEMAMIYYDSEKHPNESFDEYVERYSDSAFEICQSIGLDFSIFLMFSKRARDVSNATTIQGDIDISRKQILATVAENLLETDGKLVAGVTTQKTARTPFDRMRYRLSRRASDKLPIPIRQAARIDGPLTLGAFDLETINFAKAVSESPRAAIELALAYPDVSEHFQQLKRNFDALAENKAKAVGLIETLYPDLAPLVIRFLQDGNNAHLAAIGIDEDTIDDWHRTHSSIPFVHYMISSDLETAAKNTRAFYQGTFEKDQPDVNERGKILLRDELLNPKFLPYLRKQGLLEGLGNLDALDQLEEIASQLTDSVQLAVVSERLAAASIGPHEIDSHYQLLTTAAHLRRLQSVVEAHDGKVADVFNRNELGYLIYRMGAMTDWPPHFIQTGRFNGLPATKADPWDTASPIVLGNFDKVLKKATELGHPLNPGQDLNKFLFYMGAFDDSTPNPFALPMHVRNELANTVWLNTHTPPVGSWDFATSPIDGYFRYEARVPYLTQQQREQLQAGEIPHGDNYFYVGSTESAEFKTIESVIEALDSRTSPGETIVIMLDENFQLDRTITFPKDRHIVFHGFGNTLAFGSQVEVGFMTKRGNGGQNIWISNLKIEASRTNSRRPFTLIDYDGQNTGNLTIDQVEMAKLYEGAIDTTIKCRNAVSMYADGVSLAGSRPLVLDGVQYARIQSSRLIAKGDNAVGITMKYNKLPGSAEIDNFASLQINETDLEDFAVGVSTDSPEVHISYSSLDVEKLVCFESSDPRSVAKIDNTYFHSVPQFDGTYNLHLDGTKFWIDDIDKALAGLSQIAQFDRQTVFTTVGNDIMLPVGITEDKRKHFEKLEGPLFTLDENPGKRIYIPSVGKSCGIPIS